MRLQAHQAVGEWVVALVDQQLHAQKFDARLRHLARAFDEEIIVHPQSRAARVAATMRLVLLELVRMVDFAGVGAAGVDIDRKSVVLGKGLSVRVARVGRRLIQKNKKTYKDT